MMLLLWCDAKYLVTMALIGAALVLTLRWLLLKRRRQRERKETAGAGSARTQWLAPLSGLWCLLFTVYSLELGFAAFVDTTDAFNATSVSARWFRRHVEPFRNNEGFRDRRQFRPAPPEGKTRIIMIGDSFTIGQGIERMEDRFSDLSESAINARVGPDQEPVQIYNFGEFGWEVSVIEGMVAGILQSDYQPRIVVYIYMLNDIEGYDPRTEEVIRTIQQHKTTSRLVTNSYLINWLHFLWLQHRAQRTVDYFPHLADSYREAPWQGVKKKLASLHQRCENHNTELRMVFFPFLHNLGPDYSFLHAHKLLADFCRENGIRHLDLEPLLSARRDEGLMVNRYDNHPNELCHQIVAEAICEQLLDDLPFTSEHTLTPQQQ